jgi:hypothetical protein
MPTILAIQEALVGGLQYKGSPEKTLSEKIKQKELETWLK